MQARRQFVAGDHQAALATLHEFSPQELVAPVIAELETELRRLKRRREESAIRPAVTGPVAAPPVIVPVRFLTSGPRPRTSNARLFRSLASSRHRRHGPIRRRSGCLCRIRLPDR